MSPCVVIDANRIFSELIAANHQLRRAPTSLPGTRFICLKYVFVEIFKHQERIADTICIFPKIGSCVTVLGKNNWLQKSKRF